jgi:hypothetical protein
MGRPLLFYIQNGAISNFDGPRFHRLFAPPR